MPAKKAEFIIEDMIVSVACPDCGSKPPSPKYPNSIGWDKSEVKSVGKRGKVKCLHCGSQFGLPARLFDLMNLR